MSSIILCSPVKAKRPFYIESIKLNLYSIEELCFYICNNIHLINNDFVSDELIKWINDELELKDLSANLDNSSIKKSISRSVVEILEYVGFCEEDELEEITHILIEKKDETEEEQRKKRADNFLKNGKYEYAIREYDLILQYKPNERLGNHFYGKVYHNMGVAYARQFLYETASEMFKKAFELAGLDESLKEYLACAYMYMSQDQYESLIAKNNVYKVISETLKSDLKNFEYQYNYYKEKSHNYYKNINQRIEECKEEYRRNLL